MVTDESLLLEWREGEKQWEGEGKRRERWLVLSCAVGRRILGQSGIG